MLLKHALVSELCHNKIIVNEHWTASRGKNGWSNSNALHLIRFHFQILACFNSSSTVVFSRPSCWCEWRCTHRRTRLFTGISILGFRVTHCYLIEIANAVTLSMCIDIFFIHYRYNIHMNICISTYTYILLSPNMSTFDYICAFLWGDEKERTEGENKTENSPKRWIPSSSVQLKSALVRPAVVCVLASAIEFEIDAHVQNYSSRHLPEQYCLSSE